MDDKAAIVKQGPPADNGLEEGGLKTGEIINVGGHKQELDRQFSLLSICSVGIVVGNAWTALGGSIVSNCCVCSKLQWLAKNAWPPGCRTLQWRAAWGDIRVVRCISLVIGSILMYEDSIAVSMFYWLVAASLAELASAVPSSGGGQ